MKTRLFLALVLALATLSLAEVPKSGAGIKLHMNLASAYGDDVNEDNLANRNGFGATGFVSFQFGNYFSLQPELSYMSRGSTTENVSYYAADMTTKLDYFQFLILMRFTIPTNTPITPSFFFGPAGALNIDAKVDIDTDVPYNDDLDNVRVYDAGPVFGAGIDVNIGPGAIVAEGRYYMGLLKILDYTDYDRNPDTYNKAVELAIGYKFNL